MSNLQSLQQIGTGIQMKFNLGTSHRLGELHKSIAGSDGCVVLHVES